MRYIGLRDADPSTKVFQNTLPFEKNKIFSTELYPASILFFVLVIVMVAIFGVISPHFTLFSIECIISTIYTIITAEYALHTNVVDISVNKQIYNAMFWNFGGLLALFLQYAQHMTIGLHFSFRIIFIVIGLTAILCAYFYRLIPNKNSLLLMKTWEQALVLACSIFLILNIQLDSSTPQFQNYKIYQFNNFIQDRILDDGRTISGSDAYPDEYGNGTVLLFEGWFHVNYYLESDY